MKLSLVNIKNWIEFYYYLTIAFAISDYVFGLNFRTTGFELFPEFKKFYYLTCFCLGFIIHARSNLGTYVAVTESLINISAIIYSIYLLDQQILTTVENPEQGGSFYWLIESRNNYYLNFVLCVAIMFMAVTLSTWKDYYYTMRSKVAKKKQY